MPCLSAMPGLSLRKKRKELQMKERAGRRRSMGSQVDPKTGLPLEMLRQDRVMLRAEQEQQSQAEGYRLDAALKEEDGRTLVKTVREMLTKRVDELVKDDAEASTFVKLLKEIGVKIAIGRTMAERIIARELKEASDGKR